MKVELFFRASDYSDKLLARLPDTLAQRRSESLARRVVGKGAVHRLWEPLALKRKPPNGHAAKLSTPYCIAIGFLAGKAGLAEFTDARARDRAARALAAKVGYVVDPANAYPRNFTGHIRARLADGSEREVRQPHMRGGARKAFSRRSSASPPAARSICAARAGSADYWNSLLPRILRHARCAGYSG